jgi:selenoprotein W-related protein
MTRPTLTVTYCTSCGYRGRALWFASELLSQLEHEIGSLRLVPGDRGVFDWAVGEQVIFSRGASGRFHP